MQTLYTAALGAIGLSQSNDNLAADILRQQFVNHVNEFGYSYGTKEEFEFRFERYLQSEKEIAEINAQDMGFKLAHNQFSTWTEAEYQRMLSKKPTKGESKLPYEDLDESLTAATVDWRKQGAVQPIQNQGYCGSCWAFNAIATMEGAHKIATGELIKLSEQQMVDCDTRSGGCDGGLEIWGWQYAAKKPIALRSHYPYTAKDGKCNDANVAGKVKVTAQYGVKNTVAAHKAALNKQPVALGINASNRIFQSYSSGILQDPKGSCKPYIDHGVTAVGYGTENGLDYMIVRNSWGTGWGESGYFRVAIDKDGAGVCGVQDDTSYCTTN